MKMKDLIKDYGDYDVGLIETPKGQEREWAGTKKFGTTKSAEVYVTFESPKGERFCRHVCFQNGKLSNYDQSCIDAWFKGSKPIAWQPLPKPYEVKER